MIKVEQGLLLLLQFTAFDIQPFRLMGRPNDILFCSDHLTIMDGDGTILMEKSCGPHMNGSIYVEDETSWRQVAGPSLPAPMRSRSNIVNLMFSSDGGGVGINWGGWSLSWSAVTPGIFMCSTATAHICSTPVTKITFVST